ncbi:U1 small nuclear ribonucleoprotein C [Penicillium diatomitis]|uniref:U1 small nuclear ribonucleoprotein C n=1 Tax=Penicillium diatomitis TaxID=2819901 RepID=A0A9W9X395_9EURO|nr:U1 small nuclear ribonucleoprotein C [Penicillium diatomitis]KAJ5482840.1 U1 small nuclear ribonucleoprotein C [Penicillium diatomitis]
MRKATRVSRAITRRRYNQSSYSQLISRSRLGDYCDVYLTHDSMSVRKAHNSGRNHLRNVVDYYQRKWQALPTLLIKFLFAGNCFRCTDTLPSEIGQEKAQSVIDSITSSYAAEGKAVPNPAMVPPGALPPPPFGFPGHPGQMPPPFGIPPPGAPGAPAMPPFPPGGRGMPFPPPFPPNASGTPPQGGFPPPMPNMPNMPPGAGNLPPPHPGGFPNFPIPPPGAPGAFPPPMHSQQHGAMDSPAPRGPRGSDSYPPPPGGGGGGGGYSHGRGDRW